MKHLMVRNQYHNPIRMFSFKDTYSRQKPFLSIFPSRLWDFTAPQIANLIAVRKLHIMYFLRTIPNICLTAGFYTAIAVALPQLEDAIYNNNGWTDQSYMEPSVPDGGYRGDPTLDMINSASSMDHILDDGTIPAPDYFSYNTPILTAEKSDLFCPNDRKNMLCCNGEATEPDAGNEEGFKISDCHKCKSALHPLSYSESEEKQFEMRMKRRGGGSILY